MIDYIVDDRTGKRVSDDVSEPEKFTELWKFVLGQTGWVLDEIEQNANIFELSHFHPFSQETGFIHRSQEAT